jgi:hypothetical protein
MLSVGWLKSFVSTYFLAPKSIGVEIQCKKSKNDLQYTNFRHIHNL